MISGLSGSRRRAEKWLASVAARHGGNMTKFTDQQRAANYMGAIAHLLSGGADRHAEFIDKVELILSGDEAHAFELMQFDQACRTSGRPVLWVHSPGACPPCR
jgi:hypothetical protein